MPYHIDSGRSPGRGEAERLKQGFVQMYIGDGKGKTSAALGLAARAACAFLRVGIYQFMKSGQTSELSLPWRFPGLIEIRQLGRPGFIGPGGPDPEDVALAREGLAILAGETSWDFDIVIADEILTAVTLGLLTEPEVEGLLEMRPEGTELVLTGRYPRDGRLVGLADLVTEMCEVKHYWRNGIEAREGIEF